MSLRPLPGCVVVRLDPLFKNTGTIEIPEAYLKARNLNGTIASINNRPSDGDDLAVGDRVLVSPVGGDKFDDECKIYRICDIVAKIEGEVELQPHTQDVERCQHCGAVNSSHQNMILWNGICPRCHRNAQNVKIDSNKKVSESEVESFSEVFYEKQAKAYEDLQKQQKEI